MNIAETLREVTRHAQKMDDLPDYLATRIFAIADKLTEANLLCTDIEKLIDQVKLYDTYGQTGYLGMGVNHSILEKTIKHIEGHLSESS